MRQKRVGGSQTPCRRRIADDPSDTLRNDHSKLRQTRSAALDGIRYATPPAALGASRGVDSIEFRQSQPLGDEMVTPTGLQQESPINDLAWRTLPLLALLKRGAPKRLANLSGAPPTPESRAPAAAGTATGAELPHLAGGSDFDSTIPKQRQLRPIVPRGFGA